MATILYKTAGEKVTAAEAQSAANSFTPDEGYEFIGWSATAGSTATVDFSNGIEITTDKTFYPVEKIEDLFKKGGLPDGSWSRYTVDGESENFLTTPQLYDFSDLTEGSSPASVGKLYNYEIKKYIHIGATVGALDEGNPGIPFSLKVKDIIDFGFIDTSGITDSVSFSVKSSFSNTTYYLKLTKTSDGFDFSLLFLYDSISTHIIPANRLTGYSLGDIVPINDALSYLGTNNEYSLRYLSYDSI